MPIGGERSAVQNPFLRYARNAGWSYLSPDDALDLRRGTTSPVLDSVLFDQLQALNPGVVDAARAEQIRDRLVRVRPNIEGNLDAWEYLKGLKTVFVDAEKRERNVRLLDPVNVDANKFHVTDEFTFSNGTPPDIRKDIVLFINGVPVIVGETKSATHSDGIAEALDDIRYYHRQGPELLAVLQLHSHHPLDPVLLRRDVEPVPQGAVQLARRAGGRLRDAGEDVHRPGAGAASAYGLHPLHPHGWGAWKGRVAPAPDARRGALRGASQGKEKRRGLIWHTQGSGKTYTMITTAKRLIEDPSSTIPPCSCWWTGTNWKGSCIDNLEAVGFGHVAVAKSKDHLRRCYLPTGAA